jgi:phosphoribosylanthranilate isomerase
MKVKVCGMREPDNLKQVAALLPDFMGFIFYKGSKRYVEEKLTPELLESLPASIKKVGVFVNEDTETIKALAAKYQLDVIQLHGRETPKQCQELKSAGLEVIKVFSVDDKFVFENTLLYERCCDYFLFDTKGKEYGGNGFPFDWELMKDNLSSKPYFLSGGINPDNIKFLNKVRPAPYAIDVNSGYELEPGLKNVDQVKELIKLVKKNN